LYWTETVVQQLIPLSAARGGKRVGAFFNVVEMGRVNLDEMLHLHTNFSIQHLNNNIFFVALHLTLTV
jgi:hypothetical protein